MSIRLSATFVSYRNERCYSPEIFKVLKVLILGIFILGLESCHLPSYAYGVHPHGELALVGYKFSNGAQSARAFFVREILSTNPFRLRHPHLVVNGEAPLNSSGAH